MDDLEIVFDLEVHIDKIILSLVKTVPDNAFIYFSESRFYAMRMRTAYTF